MAMPGKSYGFQRAPLGGEDRFGFKRKEGGFRDRLAGMLQKNASKVDDSVVEPEREKITKSSVQQNVTDYMQNRGDVDMSGAGRITNVDEQGNVIGDDDKNRFFNMQNLNYMSKNIDPSDPSMVLALQKKLNKMGGFNLEEDGVMGELTTKALRIAQGRGLESTGNEGGLLGKSSFNQGPNYGVSDGSVRM
jgi:hypothetical protein